MSAIFVSLKPGLTDKLSLNYNKTNFMLLTSRKHNPASFKVAINDHTISPEDNLK